MPRVPAVGWPTSAGAITSLDSILGGETVYNTMNVAMTTLTGWVAASRAILMPLMLNDWFTFSHIGWENGATVSGNVDVGVYDKSLAKVVTAGATAQAGVSATQVATVATTTIPPDFYWLAMVLDNTTGTVRSAVPGSTLIRGLGLQQMAAAYVLPATITLTIPASNFWPLITLGVGEFT